MKIFGFYIARELPVVEKTIEVEKVVEKIEYVALGDEVNLYQASSPNIYGYRYANEALPPWNGQFFLSCQQALEECSGAIVSKRAAYKSGKTYFIHHGIQPVEVQPKPKMPKGKAA